jgi:hypothetical protein
LAARQILALVVGVRVPARQFVCISAWKISSEGRKHRGASALFDDSGGLVAYADPVGLVRRGRSAFALAEYVNDRPYVASSFLSVDPRL